MTVKAVKFTTITNSGGPFLISGTEDQAHNGQEYGRDWGTKVVVYNGSAVTIYIGGADVDTAGTKGFPIAATSYSPVLDLSSPDDLLYAYAGAAATPVYVINLGV